MNTDNTVKQRTSLLDLDGMPKMSQAVPLALQHIVAMIVGCVAPVITIPGAAGIDTASRVLLIQTSLVASTLATLPQFFPLGNKNSFHLDSDLPVILSVGFAYVPNVQAIAEQFDVPATLGAQTVGGVYATLVGLIIKKIRKFFPSLIAGTVVFAVGLSLYPTAINYMVDGAGQSTCGTWQDWVVAISTLVIVTVLNHFARGFLRLASILIGMVAGYTLSMSFGVVSFSSVAESDMFQLPQVMYFGISFEASACMALGLLFVINSVRAIGDFSATTVGGLDREPTTNELHGAILGYDFPNIIGAFLECLSTATYNQDVGTVATTRIVNRVTLGLFALIILTAGLFPKFFALLTAVPYAVLGGVIVSVFTSIAMTGMRPVMTEDMNYRNTSTVGLAAALGADASQASAPLSVFPAWVTTIFEKSPVVIATLVVILSNVTLPKDIGKVEKS